MRSTLLDEVKSAVKNWWLSLILGILFIMVSVLLMFTPVEAYMALSILFSICMFASGVFEIAFSISNRENLSGWGWYLAGGIIDLLLGLFLILQPAVSMAVIPFIVAFWFMFRGFSAIGFSIDLSRYGVKGWGWYLVFGILAILCSMAIIWQPAVGALSVVYIIAFAFMFIGVFRIMLAFDLKSLHNNSEKMKERLDSLTHSGKSE